MTAEVYKVEEVEGAPFSIIGVLPSMKLPPPNTFAEGQRLVYGLLAAAAGMFCGIGAIAMTALLMWGRWSRQEEHTIVMILTVARRIYRRDDCRDRWPAGWRPSRALQNDRQP